MFRGRLHALSIKDLLCRARPALISFYDLLLTRVEVVLGSSGRMGGRCVSLKSVTRQFHTLLPSIQPTRRRHPAPPTSPADKAPSNFIAHQGKQSSSAPLSLEGYNAVGGEITRITLKLFPTRCLHILPAFLKPWVAQRIID